MRKVTTGLLIALAVLLSACNSIPPTMVVMVVTSTPDPGVVQVTITPTGAEQVSTAPVGGAVVGPQGGASAAPKPTATPAPTATFGPTQTLSAFPTETRAQLYIAQEEGTVISNA